jgi:hypothetical protein
LAGWLTFHPFDVNTTRTILSIFGFGAVVILFLGCSSVQRRLLYFPSHQTGSNGLSEWKHQDQLIGFSRVVQSPKNVWLLIHGNGGQAADRTYALPSFSDQDSVFILEYPGYGTREGIPSLKSFNDAAGQAYEILRGQFPNLPVCVASESIGTGPASTLTGKPNPPDKLVLIVPFDVLSKVASDHFPFLPTKLLLRDNWNNIEALAKYDGPLEIFAAKGDTVIPIAHAKALAATKPQAIFHEIEGGHNDWSHGLKVEIRNP